MTTVSSFSRENDGSLRALNVVLWENLVLVVVLVLESKVLYFFFAKQKLRFSVGFFLVSTVKTGGPWGRGWNPTSTLARIVNNFIIPRSE